MWLAQVKQNDQNHPLCKLQTKRTPLKKTKRTKIAIKHRQANTI